MLAVDTLPVVNMCTHLVPIEYGTAWWLSASCCSSWHSHGFRPWGIDILMYRCFHFVDFHVWMKLSVLWYLCLKYMCTSAHVPFYDWNIASAWCMLSQLYTPFPSLPHCWQKTSCRNLWRTHMYICMYVSTCLHMCVPTMFLVFAWTGFESLFACICVYQIYNMVLCTDCQVQHYSILMVLC
jgi:hypothetical protein